MTSICADVPTPIDELGVWYGEDLLKEAGILPRKFVSHDICDLKIDFPLRSANLALIGVTERRPQLKYNTT
jgi:hypothetical protein